jgi:hypothetical protein
MKRQKHLILAIVALIATVLVAAGPVAARENKEEVSGKECYGELYDPEDASLWLSEEGILHIRGAKQENTIECDDPRVAGESIVVVNANLEFNGGVWVGPMWGTYQIEVDDGGFKGFWDGTWTGTLYADGSMSTRAHADGSGDLEGLKIFVTTERAGPYDACGEFTGYILNTDGE